ncbi:MAG TPA: Rossmann-like and DUF2520 domain-containing protein [Thermoanaerobaculia bacterium]|nr:Rossmann-like and DUF2520 domain-containing protein [Thermoanaerobaculia bacterium]
MDGALSGLRFSLVGPGRVGVSLARWALAGGASLHRVARRSGGSTDLKPDPALPAAEPLAGLTTAGDDLLLLAVPDNALSAVAAELAARPQARVVLHTSGSLSAEILAPLRASVSGVSGVSGVAGTAGSAVGSLHPLKAFPRPLPDPAEARGVLFALDGDPPARALARRLATAWEGLPAEVPAAARTLYHLAASLAAGGVVTLLALADELAHRLGLPPEVGRGYLELARGAIAAALATPSPESAARALTGPVARGDAATFARQLTALADLAPEKLPLVLHLALETLRQQARLAPLGEAQRELKEELEERLRRGASQSGG